MYIRLACKIILNHKCRGFILSTLINLVFILIKTLAIKIQGKKIPLRGTGTGRVFKHEKKMRAEKGYIIN